MFLAFAECYPTLALEFWTLTPKRYKQLMEAAGNRREYLETIGALHAYLAGTLPNASKIPKLPDILRDFVPTAKRNKPKRTTNEQLIQQLVFFGRSLPNKSSGKPPESE